MSKVTPEKIESIVLDDVEQYERVGLSHEGWVNGGTPINEDNLNIGDLALYKLLGSKESGYIQRLVSSLNSETRARFTDVTNLDSALSMEASERRDAEKSLENSIESLIQTHNQDITRLENKDRELHENIETEAARIEAAIPLRVSQLENDAGYLTEYQSLDNYYTKQEVAESYATKEEVVSVQDELILNCGNATILV